MIEEMKKEFGEKFCKKYEPLLLIDSHFYNRADEIWQWIETKIDEACKKAKVEELSNFLVIVSGATDILDRMQTIEVLHNRIKELSPKESE